VDSSSSEFYATMFVMEVTVVIMVGGKPVRLTEGQTVMQKEGRCRN
jgi:hypothetical protein